jgi:hypothetical protein
MEQMNFILPYFHLEEINVADFNGKRIFMLFEIRQLYSSVYI